MSDPDSNPPPTDASPPQPPSPTDQSPPAEANGHGVPTPAIPPVPPPTTARTPSPSPPSLPPAEVNGHSVPAPALPSIPPPTSARTPPARVPQRAPASNDPISRFRNKNTEPDDARMGFIEHLLELRKRLWISIVAVVLCVVAALIFYEPVYNFLLEPVRVVDAKYSRILRERGTPTPDGQVIHITSTQPLSTMVMVIWLGFWAGLVLASPIVMYEVWAFVAPGLHDKEKNAIKPVLYGGVFFFLGGAAVAYYFLAPVSFDFFLWLDLRLKVTPNWTSEMCIEMLITMMIISGLLMEIPLLVAGLARLGAVEPAWLIKYWKVLTFGSVMLGMIVSPGNDIASMSAFSGLILGIYLISILMAYIFYRKPHDPTAKKA